MSNLNEKQLEAVNTIDGPVLILAGAGSGKTTVLINRIGNMIESKNIPPWNILAITFTNKAANEIKERLQFSLGEQALDINTGTFHSLCVRILRRDCERLGYKSGFAIYDSADQLTLIKDTIKELGFSDKDFPPRLVLSIISSAKDKMITPESFEIEEGSDFRLSKIAKIYKLYQSKLKRFNAFDFDDLIMQTVCLLEKNPDVLEYYQRKFRYIMVDEYQDTSHCQFRLVHNLAKAHNNICVVGDDDQSIYKFRGADISNILDFEKHFKNAYVIKLEQNYRSTKQILDAANEVIKNNKGRKSKALWTDKTDGEKIVGHEAQNEREEAYYIVNKIADLLNDGYKYKDIAVLFRMNAQSRVIEEVFMNNSVPYRLLSGTKFYDRKEIKDIVAYLRLISNPDDDISLTRIINEPKRSIGKTTVDKLSVIASKYGLSIYTIIKNLQNYDELSKSAQKLDAFVKIVDELVDLKNKISLNEIVNKMLQSTGYVSALEIENTVESKTRLENIKEFMSLVLEFEKNCETGSLEEFLEGIALVSDIDSYDDENNAVVVMTLHSAKGLEFPAVFLTGLEEGIFPSQRSLTEEGGIEEERRLCYVGITRAKNKLYLLNSRARTIFGSTTYQVPSRFLDEIPDSMIERLAKKQSQDANYNQNRFNTIFDRNTKINTGSTDFSVGDRVSHAKFGEGIVLSVVPMGSDAKLQIAFDSVGTKNLMATFAKLKKL
ncbi:MAG: DNA helicase PcrA [Clostridia bacterium]|nr:DNA helicase PcrA [Clostridia bacterium]